MVAAATGGGTAHCVTVGAPVGHACISFYCSACWVCVLCSQPTPVLSTQGWGGHPCPQVTRLSHSRRAVVHADWYACVGVCPLPFPLQLRPKLAESILQRTKLLKWLLGRIRVKGSDSNKQYASEVLSILVQGHEPNQALLGKGNGVDTLLVCLAGFKSKEPVDELEQETMENLFDTLCSCLLLPANR